MRKGKTDDMKGESRERKGKKKERDGGGGKICFSILYSRIPFPQPLNMGKVSCVTLLAYITLGGGSNQRPIFISGQSEDLIQRSHQSEAP